MNTINLIQEGFGTASCALLFVCICVFIVIYDASHSVAATHQLKFHDLGFTIMPGPKEGDEELKVGSEESEWPMLEAITTSTSKVTPLLSLPPPPPPPPPSLVMSIDELAAAFQKLGITNVSAVKVFEVVREEQAHRRKAHIERGKILLHSTSESSKTQIRGIPPYTSTTVKRAVPPTAEEQERHRRLRILMKDAFLDGQIPDPYTSVDQKI